MHIFCDFDGTVSSSDATDQVLEKFAEGHWREIEDDWSRGIIGSRECMQRQIALIRATLPELNSFLDTISIDLGFRGFLSFCRSNALPLTIVSDGVDYFIKRILKTHQISGLPIMANVLNFSKEDDRDIFALSSPHASDMCLSASGVCKCKVVEQAETRIYIGDGRSDFCVSDKVDIVFAKDRLADYCRNQEIPFIRFDGFTDLLPKMRSLLPVSEKAIPAWLQSQAL